MREGAFIPGAVLLIIILNGARTQVGLVLVRAEREQARASQAGFFFDIQSSGNASVV